MRLFSALLIIILLFYVFSMIINLVFKRKMKKMEQQMRAYDQDNNPSASDKTPKNPHIDPSIGEYTDYEEIQ